MSCHDLTAAVVAKAPSSSALGDANSSYPRPLNFVQMTRHTRHRRHQREKMLLSFFLGLYILFRYKIIRYYYNLSGCPTHSFSTGRRASCTRSRFRTGWLVEPARAEKGRGALSFLDSSFQVCANHAGRDGFVLAAADPQGRLPDAVAEVSLRQPGRCRPAF